MRTKRVLHDAPSARGSGQGCGRSSASADFRRRSGRQP
jgi:hypothetical protein